MSVCNVSIFRHTGVLIYLVPYIYCRDRTGLLTFLVNLYIFKGTGHDIPYLHVGVGGTCEELPLVKHPSEIKI